MSFGDEDLVEITYQANVQGMEQVEALNAQTKEVQASTQAYTGKLNEARIAQTRHTSAVAEAGREVGRFHRELTHMILPATLVVGALIEIGKGSESVAKLLEDASDKASRFAGAIGNAVAYAGAFYGALSTGASRAQAMALAEKQVKEAESLKTTIARLSLEEKAAKMQGDDLLALQIRQSAEQLQIKERYHGDSYRILKDALDREQAAERESFRLSELGLKNHLQIKRDFNRNLVGGAQGSTSNVIENFLNGQKQTPGDIAKTFQAGFSHAIAEALSQSLFTSFASGGNFFSNMKNILTGRTPAVIAAERSARAAEEASKLNSQMLAVLNQIAECTCSTARSISGASVSGPSGKNTAGKISAVAGLIGAIAGGGASFGGGFGGFGGGGGVAPPPSVPAPPPTLTIDTMPKFPSGGEVPIGAMPGEFVVRRPAAMENRELLRSLNAGAGSMKSTGGGGHVFLIKANDAQSFVDMLASPASRSAVEIQLIKSIMNNSTVRNVIKEFAR